MKAVLLEHGGLRLSITDWAERLGVTKQTLWWRLKVWPIEKALSPKRRMAPVEVVAEKQAARAADGSPPAAPARPEIEPAARYVIGKGIVLDKQRNCVQCGRLFSPAPMARLTCSGACRAKYLADWPHEIDEAPPFAGTGAGEAPPVEGAGPAALGESDGDPTSARNPSSPAPITSEEPAEPAAESASLEAPASSLVPEEVLNLPPRVLSPAGAAVGRGTDRLVTDRTAHNSEGEPGPTSTSGRRRAEAAPATPPADAPATSPPPAREAKSTAPPRRRLARRRRGGPLMREDLVLCCEYCGRPALGMRGRKRACGPCGGRLG